MMCNKVDSASILAYVKIPLKKIRKIQAMKYILQPRFIPNFLIIPSQDDIKIECLSFQVKVLVKLFESFPKLQV